MHEEVLFRDLLRKLDEVATAHQAHRITRVRLWVGALSHLSETHLHREWSERTQGTVAEGSSLEVTLSHDLRDPRAQGILLESVDVEA